MSIVTKTGDGGQTALVGGTRVSKDHPRLEAYGSIDELGAWLGVVLTYPLPPPFPQQLRSLQRQLFQVGADLAAPQAASPYLKPQALEELESNLQALLADLPPQKGFILCGGSPAGARLHLARAVCRRAERQAVTLSHNLAPGEYFNPQVLIYLNRLSDYLYVAARLVNLQQGGREEEL